MKYGELIDRQAMADVPDTNVGDTIYRQAAIAAAVEAADEWDGGYSCERERIIEEALARIPSAERKRGKWIKGAEISNRYLEDVYYCSNCHKQAYWDTDYDQQLFDYCPYCGSFNGGQASE